MRRRYHRLFKHIPTQESIREYGFLKPVRRYLDHHFLWQFNRRAVAGGAAVGLFFSMASPVGQIPLAVLFAILLRVNLPVAVFGTLLSNPFTTPALLYCGYKLGALLIGHEAPARIAEIESELEAERTGYFGDAVDWLLQALDWIQSAGLPLVVGVGTMSVLMAMAGYIGVMVLWRLQATLRWRARCANAKAGKER